MRFSDFFISYKLGLKELKATIPFKEFPLCKKIFMILTFVLTVLGIIFAILNRPSISFAFLAVMIILMIIFIAIEFFPVYP